MFLTRFVIVGPSPNTTQTTIDNAIIVRIILNDFDDLMQTKIEKNEQNRMRYSDYKSIS